MDCEEYYFDSILEGLSEGVLVFDEELSILKSNQRALRFLKVESEDLLRNEIPLFKNSSFSSALSQVQKGRVAEQRFKITENGAILHCRLGMLPDSEDCEAKLYLILEDVSRFFQMDEIKFEFINSLLFRLRNPLTSVKTAMSILNSGKMELNEAVKEVVAMSHQEITRLHLLLADLRNIFSIETGLSKGELFFETIALQKAVARSIQELAKTKGDAVNKRIEIKGDYHVQVSADYEKLTHALFQLIKNALAYSPKDHPVQVRVSKTPHAVVVEVKDEGIGIDKKDMPYLYDKFFRADNAANREIDGNGIGLYVARGFINEMGGSLFCESESGKGTTFTLSLPHPENGKGQEPDVFRDLAVEA